MTPADPVAELLFAGADTPISIDPSTVMPWAAARDELAAAPKFWLATGRPGSPRSARSDTAPTASPPPAGASPGAGDQPMRTRARTFSSGVTLMTYRPASGG